MRNRIIAAYSSSKSLVSITVENPDFSELRVNQFKNWRQRVDK